MALSTQIRRPSVVSQAMLLPECDRLLKALAYEAAVYRDQDGKDDEYSNEACDTASRAAGIALRDLLRVDMDALPTAAHRVEYQISLAAALRWLILPAGDYHDADDPTAMLSTRLVDLVLAGTAFDRADLWLWHTKGVLQDTPPPRTFPNRLD